MVPTSHIYHYTHFRWVGTTNYAPEADCLMLLSVRCPRIEENVKCWCEPGVMWTQSWNISLNGDIKYFVNLPAPDEWMRPFWRKTPFLSYLSTSPPITAIHPEQYPPTSTTPLKWGKLVPFHSLPLRGVALFIRHPEEMLVLLGGPFVILFQPSSASLTHGLPRKTVGVGAGVFKCLQQREIQKWLKNIVEDYNIHSRNIQGFGDDRFLIQRGPFCVSHFCWKIPRLLDPKRWQTSHLCKCRDFPWPRNTVKLYAPVPRFLRRSTLTLQSCFANWGNNELLVPSAYIRVVKSKNSNLKNNC